MSAAGIEPATLGLKGHCSAIELRARTSIYNTLVSDILTCTKQHVNIRRI